MIRIYRQHDEGWLEISSGNALDEHAVDLIEEVRCSFTTLWVEGDDHDERLQNLGGELGVMLAHVREDEITGIVHTPDYKKQATFKVVRS